jgi:hypothetical protein
MLQLDKHGTLNIRRLTPRFAEQFYDDRTEAVDMHRNGSPMVESLTSRCSRTQ